MSYVQIHEELVEKVVDILVKVVESEGSTLASIAMESLGHIGLRCALPSISRNSSAGKTIQCSPPSLLVICSS
jgi:proteasome component ECM29